MESDKKRRWSTLYETGFIYSQFIFWNLIKLILKGQNTQFRHGYYMKYMKFVMPSYVMELTFIL